MRSHRFLNHDRGAPTWVKGQAEGRQWLDGWTLGRQRLLADRKGSEWIYTARGEGQGRQEGLGLAIRERGGARLETLRGRRVGVTAMLLGLNNAFICNDRKSIPNGLKEKREQQSH